MSESDRGDLIAHHAARADAERSLARVRTATALIVAVASTLVLLGDVPVPVFLAAALGLLMSLIWLAQARRASRRAENASSFHLSVFSKGFLLAEGAHQTWVSWQDVAAVEVDEEHLEVVVSRRQAPPLRLEPRYPGVEIHALMHTLRSALEKSCSP
jgi:hypothetical protein